MWLHSDTTEPSHHGHAHICHVSGFEDRSRHLGRNNINKSHSRARHCNCHLWPTKRDRWYVFTVYVFAHCWTDIDRRPKKKKKATEWILSGIYVCGPSVDTTSPLPFAWDILAIVVSSILFLLAMGRFFKNAFDMRRMFNKRKVNDLMAVLARDSIVYFFLYVYFLFHSFGWVGVC